MVFPADKLTRIVGVQWDDHPFLALDTGGAMGTSEDGIQWIPVAGYTGPVLTMGAFGNDMFLAARGTGEMMKSPDGHTWEAVAGNPFSSGFLIQDVVFGGDRFLVVALDAATQTVVSAAVLTQGADGNDVWSTPASPPLTGSDFLYNGAGFSAGQFFIFGSQGFSASIRQVIGYDFSLNEPIYSSPSTENWRKSRLTRSTNGIAWGGLEDPFNAIDGGTSGTITITNPAPPFNSVTIPQTDPDVSQVTTDCDYIAQQVPEGGSVVVAQTTNVPGRSFARYSGGSWQISPSDVRNVSGGLAYGEILSGQQLVDRFVALGSNADGDLGYLTSPNGLSWAFTAQGVLGPGTPPTVFGEDLFVTARGVTLFYSSNGANWQDSPSDLGATLYASVVY